MWLMFFVLLQLKCLRLPDSDWTRLNELNSSSRDHLEPSQGPPGVPGADIWKPLLGKHLPPSLPPRHRSKAAPPTEFNDRCWTHTCLHHNKKDHRGLPDPDPSPRCAHLRQTSPRRLRPGTDRSRDSPQVKGQSAGGGKVRR